MENLVANSIPGGALTGETLLGGKTCYDALNPDRCAGNFSGMYHSAQGKSFIKVTDPYSQFSLRDREAMAHTWHFHLISAECTLTSCMCTYVHELEKMMQEHGLLKFRMKRNMKELSESVSALQKMVEAHGLAQIRIFCKPIFAPLADEFRADGGDLTNRLVLSIRKHFNTEITKLFFCTKNMLNRSGCPYPDVVNHLQMIMFLVNTDIEFCTVVKDRVMRLLRNDKVMSYHSTSHNARILKAAKELLYALFDEKKYPVREEDCKDVRLLAKIIQERLVGEGVRESIDEDIWAVQADFTLYVLLRLAMRLQSGTGAVSRKELKHLLVRMGDKQSVMALFDELRAVTVPEGETMIDRIDEFDIPKDENSMIRKFYELCLRNRVLYRSSLSEDEQLYRNLRLMVYRSKESMLSEDMLRYLFIVRNSVKKRVEELLVRADADVMRKTLRRLKKMKVADLSYPSGRYYFDFWKGIDRIRRERCMDDKDMMALMGVGKSHYYGLKKLTSLRYTGGQEIRRLIHDISSQLRVDAGYYLYLCMTRTDNELISELPFDEVLARGMMVYLSRNEEGREMEPGEEYQIES